MPTSMQHALVKCLSDIYGIAQEMVEGATGEHRTSAWFSAGRDSPFASYPCVPQFLMQRGNALEFDIAREDMPNRLCFLAIDDKLAVDVVVPQGDDATHPHAFLLRGGDFVADTFACDFPFKLGERELYAILKG